jgi:drug/metabolite transporter (DMT)-like permease
MSHFAPCTPGGIMEYLRECGLADGEGKFAVIIGRSDIVGKPMAKMLMAFNWTTAIAHSKTDEALKETLLKNADLVICAVGKAGFITALYILITPVSGKFLLHKPVAKNTWIGVAVALVGMYFLCLTGGIDGINLGDVIMLFAAIAASTHMHVVDHFVAKYDPVKLSCYQFTMVGLMCFIPALIFESDVFTLEYIRLSAIPILYAGLASCAVGYTFQIIGQKYTEPNTASLLLSMETVFALLAGWVILGEVLAGREYLGCAIMFAAIIIAQLPDKKR